MSDLEDALREATKAGRLNGLTLWPSQGGWQGNARWNGSEGWTVEIRKDPVEALVAALTSTERYDHSRNPVSQPQVHAQASVAEPIAAAESRGIFD